MESSVTVEIGRPMRPRDGLRTTRRAPEGDSAREIAHHMFEQRTRFGGLTDASLVEIAAAQRIALLSHPHDGGLLAEVAMILLQHRPTKHAMRLAAELVTDVETPLAHRVRSLASGLGHETSSAIERVNWSVTNQCPMTCDGCYNHFSPQSLTWDATKVALERLRHAGLRTLTVSGGDPLLWPHLEEFLRAAKDHGIKTGVDTTGFTMTPADAEMLAELTSYVGIPIDGSTETLQSSLRHARGPVLDRSLAAIRWLGDAGATVKVNTIVTGANAHDVPAIAELVGRPPGVVRHWSLFQFSPLRASPALSDRLSIDDELFSMTGRLAGVLGRRLGIDTRVRAVDERGLSHVFINDDGRVTTFGTEAGEEFLLGHVLADDLSSILRSPMLAADSAKRSRVSRFS